LKVNEVIALHPFASDEGLRLDTYLAENLEGWTRTKIQKLIADGHVKVNLRNVKSSYKVSENEIVEVELVGSPTSRFEPEEIPLQIVFEDESLAVINKPAGMVVHPGAGVKHGTLANALAYKFGISKPEFVFDQFDEEQALIEGIMAKVGIVHRIDK
jgi:23S rRNA pseudouridine1911/1915/1917 synthase